MQSLSAVFYIFMEGIHCNLFISVLSRNMEYYGKECLVMEKDAEFAQYAQQIHSALEALTFLQPKMAWR